MLQERARIARELHDSVAQTFYAITLRASRASSVLHQNDSSEVQRFIDVILQLATTGQAELRAVLREMRSDRLTSEGLTTALQTLAADARTQHGPVGLDVHVSVLDEPDLPAASKEELALIAREALHNIVKHASARHVEIVLEQAGGHWLLLITDDGRGFEPATPRPGHYGLQTMHERAAGVGGTLALVSRPAGGTQVRISIPAAPAH